VLAHERLRRRNRNAPLEQQVRSAVALLAERNALHDAADRAELAAVPTPRATNPAPLTAVVIEPDRAHASRELLGAAARLANELDGGVIAFTVRDGDARQLASWGADRIVHAPVENIEEDVSLALTKWARSESPWAILAPSTAWGREVAARTAAALRAGLTGDAVELDVADGRLVAWKPAFGGQLVAAITATSPVQLATVRTGMLGGLEPRAESDIPVTELSTTARQRVRILARTRDDDLDVLAEARVVIGIGTGVAPDEYEALEPLRCLLGAEFGATRKVTDKGWLPRARQIGITGRAIAPRLYVSIGASGKFNHVVGVRAAGTVLAINPDPDALIFDSADVGIVADWRDAVPLLVRELRTRQLDDAGSGSGR
jgi:electron transfer flavoprotein alpha subunit